MHTVKFKLLPTIEQEKLLAKSSQETEYHQENP